MIYSDLEAAVKPTTRASRMRVAVLNTYLDGRETACERGEYPRSHLWGADYLVKQGGSVEYLRPRSDWLSGVLRRVSEFVKGRLGSLDFDVELLRRASEFDVIYVPNGRFLLYQIARFFGWAKTPIIYWTYTVPADRPLYKLRDLWERELFRRGIDGLLCLTSTCAEAYAERWPEIPVRHIEWTPDEVMFSGDDDDGEFYLACGRTNRDYRTLIAAASRVDVPVVILASSNLVEGCDIPRNVRFVEGPKDSGTDKGIPYSELVNSFYRRARAVCIPRLDLPDDTSGYTNLLEALAMYRPVIMTQTGKLNLDIEEAGVGKFVEPGDIEAWVQAISGFQENPSRRQAMRSAARKLIQDKYNLERHGREVCDFISRVCAAHRSASYESGE